jgi:integrase
MKQINELMELYLADKLLAWAPSTLKSERYRLQAVALHLNGNADALWQSIKDNGAYSRLTTWVRVTDFYQWCLDEGKLTGGNPYRAFRKKNARLFKNCYEKHVPTLSFDDAKVRIESLADASIRRRALEILFSGMRWAESGKHENGSVVGKGSKRRDVFVPEIQGPEFTGCYETFRLALATVGMKPHDLRKLFLNRLVEMGANEFQLTQVAGWSSIATASSYIKVSSSATKALVNQLQGVSTNVTEVEVPSVLPGKSSAA